MPPAAILTFGSLGQFFPKMLRQVFHALSRVLGVLKLFAKHKNRLREDPARRLLIRLYTGMNV